MEIACNLSALVTKAQKDSLEKAVQVFKSAVEIRELQNGYAIRFEESKDLFTLLAKLLETNRICCPFLQQKLVVKPEKGGIWLQLTGGEGVKEYMAIDLAGLVPRTLALKTGLLLES